MKTNIIILTSSVIIAAAIVYLATCIINHGRYSYCESLHDVNGEPSHHRITILDRTAGIVYEFQSMRFTIRGNLRPLSATEYDIWYM